MSDTPSGSAAPALRRAADGTAVMVAGAIAAAILAYLFNLVGGRVLGDAEFAPIAVLWTVQFIAFTTILIPVEQLTLRRIAIDPLHPIRRDLPMLAGLVGSASVLVAGGLWLWRDRFIDGEAVHAIQGGLIVLGYGLFAFGRGRLAGRLDYRHYGIATAGESIFRFAAAISVLVVSATAPSLGWAMVVGPLVILSWRPFREMTPAEAHVEPDGAVGFLAGFVAANAAANIILAAGPIVVGALDGPPEMVSVFFISLILLRGPLTLGYGLVARILAPMARMVAKGRDAVLRKWAQAIAAAGIAAALAGLFVGRWAGPSVVALLFGEEFRPSGTLAGLLVGGIGAAMASLTVTQILVARKRTGRLAVAWLAALAAAAITIAVVSGEPDVRVGTGFFVGQVTALLGISAAVLPRDEALPTAAPRAP